MCAHIRTVSASANYRVKQCNILYDTSIHRESTTAALAQTSSPHIPLHSSEALCFRILCDRRRRPKHQTAMKPVPSWSLLAVLNALLPVGILLFAVGFFPYKPFLPGLAEFDDEAIREIAQNAPFDKVIFMVVDALRR